MPSLHPLNEWSLRQSRGGSDLYCVPRDVEAVLEFAERFWMGNAADTQSLMFGAIHWYLFSQSYSHQFERLNAQYTVLDTCFRIHCAVSGGAPPGGHAGRPSFLCARYGIPTPPWAIVTPGKGCELSHLRNALVHEAQYAGQPIGFAHPPHAYPLEKQLACLNARLILALLGVRARYLGTPVDSRERHSLDVIP